MKPCTAGTARLPKRPSLRKNVLLSALTSRMIGSDGFVPRVLTPRVFNLVVAPRFLGREGDLQVADKAQAEELPPLLDYLERVMPDSGYLVDDRLTLADIADPLRNFARWRCERRGIDVNANYRANLGNDVKFNAGVIYVHGLKSSNYENPALPDFENRILGELGDPVDEARLDLDLTRGPFTIGYRGRYIGPQYLGAYENFNALPSACTAAGCPPVNLDASDIQKYPAITYHDLRVEANIKGPMLTKALKIYLGVDNIFDKHPPLGSTATGAGSAIYDIRGRNFYAGFKANF